MIASPEPVHPADISKQLKTGGQCKIRQTQRFAREYVLENKLLNGTP
jgi:hypothetical protein